MIMRQQLEERLVIDPDFLRQNEVLLDNARQGDRGLPGQRMVPVCHKAHGGGV